MVGHSRVIPRRHPTVRSWRADNQVELVFLPTDGSWLNEAEFTDVTSP
jgi:hypothetical protein